MKHEIESKRDLEIRYPDPRSATPSSSDNEEIIVQFVSETATSLERLEGAALRAESVDTREEAMAEARRILHNLKGESGMLGLPVFADICHKAETVLDTHEARGAAPTDFLLGAKDWLQSAVECIASGQRCGSADHVAYAPTESAPTAAEGGLQTLIVEDDFTSRLLLQELLKGYGSSHVAVNGREAIEAVRIALETGEPYDLICLDIMMPEMDGQQALLEIRKLEEGHGVLPSDRARIVMTTALSDLKNVSKAYHGLCDAYLTKPIDKARLLEELRRQDLIR